MLAEDKKVKTVAYFLFLVSVLSLVTALASGALTANIGAFAIYGLLAGAWYQPGVSFLKFRPWAWGACVCLVGLFALGNALTVWSTIVLPAISAQHNGVGLGRWISLIMLFVALYILSIAFNPETRAAFRKA